MTTPTKTTPTSKATWEYIGESRPRPFHLRHRVENTDEKDKDDRKSFERPANRTGPRRNQGWCTLQTCRSGPAMNKSKNK